MRRSRLTAHACAAEPALPTQARGRWRRRTSRDWRAGARTAGCATGGVARTEGTRAPVRRSQLRWRQPWRSQLYRWQPWQPWRHRRSLWQLWRSQLLHRWQLWQSRPCRWLRLRCPAGAGALASPPACTVREASSPHQAVDAARTRAPPPRRPCRTAETAERKLFRTALAIRFLNQRTIQPFVAWPLFPKSVANGARAARCSRGLLRVACEGRRMPRPWRAA